MDSADSAEDRILIIGPSWVGDMVMAQSLFITLKRLNPGSALDVLAPPWSRPLLQRMPQVRAAIDMPVGHGAMDIGKRRDLGRSLGERRYGQAIVLPNSFKSALIPWFADIPLRTGWRGEMRYGLLNDLRRPDKRRYPLLVQRFNALAYPRGQDLPAKQPTPFLETHRDNTRPLPDRRALPCAALEGFSLDTHRRVLALCPGAEFGPAKRWPTHHYAAVAQNRIEQGWQVWLMGSERDRDVARAVFEGLAEEQRPYCKVLAGATTLARAVDLLALADAVVSNDSGLMHISAALGKPLVVVYGSTSPGFTPPLQEGAMILSNSVDCGPCFRRECPLDHRRGHLKCLNDLSPDRVIDALARFEPMDAPRPARSG
uniref:lipopolysaccharide heptosyltransferase II n=1 Tax=Candidatus Kentrum eta TaxID=2126337 RepID=A0A450URQ0_9GAMM|nr:MAG: heptosyltransferase-2 [Candidatus Kentron sp. H]VFJ96023.1 MAG: heptosyltransferase-2 [Candidatus Kentron sp. H]VFK02114.1 MAG: heptosyltransferase-2 [Candidatus Kentron sp. H]